MLKKIGESRSIEANGHNVSSSNSQLTVFFNMQDYALRMLSKRFVKL